MKEHFVRFDDALIDRLFQPLADWLNARTGFGPHRAARTAIDLAAFAWILAEAGSAAAAMATHDPRAVFASGTLIVLGLWALTTLRAMFKKLDRTDEARGVAQANPLRPGMQVHRVACLMWVVTLGLKTVLTPTGLGSLALLGVAVFATTAAYLGACNNQPPGRRQTSRSLAFGLGGA